MLIILAAFTPSAFAVTIFEDFETIGGFLVDGDGVTDFNVGTANFSGGVSGIARIPDLYHSGRHAWMVNGGETGVIQFGANTTEVSFYARAFSGADEDSIINVFDDADEIIDSLILTNTDPFTKLTVSGLINRIEFINNDSNSAQMNSLDDFSVTTVPVPGAFWLFGTAMLGFMRFSKQKLF